MVQGEAVQPPAPTVAEQTPAANATPSTPIFTLVQNGNCRWGPGQAYEVLTSLLAGGNVPIVGKNEDSTWWLVRLPTGELCWFSVVIGTSGGNTQCRSGRDGASAGAD